jgi:hypothetical protein
MRVAGRAVGLALAVVACLPAACAEPPEPIAIDGGAVFVRNLTEADWQQVQIFVNDHYSGTTRAIPAGGSVRAALGDFRAVHGQRFDYRRDDVLSVVVRATDRAGKPVRISWGQVSIR